uniref:Uncharacterized protein n=1 Tax=Human herpesvirus 1 TaxID=10298 RepID=A0A2Z4H908_HHV1|nr:hypothetical protein [Human alphaherpesvirus 1]
MTSHPGRRKPERHMQIGNCPVLGPTHPTRHMQMKIVPPRPRVAWIPTTPPMGPNWPSRYQAQPSQRIHPRPGPCESGTVYVIC